MPPVVVLGAGGMLGRALVEEWGRGYEVVGLDREELDITDEQVVKTKLTALSPAVVLNAAAYNAVDKIETDSAEYARAARLNGAAVGSLGRVCSGLSIPLFHFSSDYVFKGDCPEGYREADVPEPVSRYGATKLLGERELLSSARQFYLLRLSRLFGPVGTSPHSKKSFVDLMLDLARRPGKTELQLVDDERTGPTYSRDVAKLTREIFERELPFGVYHGANQGSCTWYEFGKKIFELRGLKVKLQSVSGIAFPRPAPRPQFSMLLNTKLPLRRPWQEALAEYLRT